MNNAKIVEPINRIGIEQAVLNILNQMPGYPAEVVLSPRAVGDVVQKWLEENFKYCIPSELAIGFDSQFSRRAMADFAFNDVTGNYFRIDCKTHCINAGFNMPNLTSVERMAKFYEDDSNYFCILKNSYLVEGERLRFTECKFVPIERIDWSCLTIGALGWGQIQLANANNLVVNEFETRKGWMLKLCDRMDMFYPNEIAKIQDRHAYFAGVRAFWEAK